MKVTIQECSAEEEEEVIIRCRGIDERMHQVQLRDICYFEAVDNRVFAYLDTKVFEIHSKLYELEQQYGNADFFRVSKSVIVNLSKVDHFSPMFQGRMDACMTNKEHVVISRQYVSLLKVRLGLKN